MKFKIKILALIVVLIGIYIFVSNNKITFAVPDSIKQAADFFLQQNKYSIKFDNADVSKTETGSQYEQIFNVNNDEITLNIYQYNDKGESDKMYNKIKNERIFSLQMDIGSKSYTQYKKNGYYIMAWRNDKTIISLKGKKIKNIKNFKQFIIKNIDKMK